MAKKNLARTKSTVPPPGGPQKRRRSTHAFCAWRWPLKSRGPTGSTSIPPFRPPKGPRSPSRAVVRSEEPRTGSLPARLVRAPIRCFPWCPHGLRRWPSMDLADAAGHLSLAPPALGPDLPSIHWRMPVNVVRCTSPRSIEMPCCAGSRPSTPDKWSDSTCVQFASKLLSAALEAGLVSKRDPRTLSSPRFRTTHWPTCSTCYERPASRGVSRAIRTSLRLAWTTKHWPREPERFLA